MENLTLNQAVEINGKQRTVLASARLYELYQQNGSKEWIRNGKESKAVLLAGSIWLFSIPIQEGGKYQWFKFKLKEGASNLGSFYRGNDEEFGPARKFANSNQTAEVKYQLFDKPWQVTDIGAFEINIDGSSDVMNNGDRLHFVTSKGEDKDYLLYLDARHGEAKGSGGSFIGEAINPELEIESIL